MSPLMPKTLTRLDPAFPPLWRDDATLQFGVAGNVRVPVSGDWVEPLLNRMRQGFRRSAFDVIAHGVGAPREAARLLLHEMRSLLRDDPPVPPAAWVESVNLTDGRAEYRMRDALADEGVPSGHRRDADGIGVILVQGAAAALQLAIYLRDDITHLPIAFEPGRITVGPLIVPGQTPCLSCRDGQERDRDPAWPLLHTQLIGSRPGLLSSVRIAQAAEVAAQILCAVSAAGPKTSAATGLQQDATARSALRAASDEAAVAHITADGDVVWGSVAFHEECRCREQSFQSPPGTATALVPLVLPRATTTETAFARRA